jgi:hypothetical protein
VNIGIKLERGVLRFAFELIEPISPSHLTAVVLPVFDNLHVLDGAFEGNRNDIVNEFVLADDLIEPDGAKKVGILPCTPNPGCRISDFHLCRRFDRSDFLACQTKLHFFKVSRVRKADSLRVPERDKLLGPEREQSRRKAEQNEKE